MHIRADVNHPSFGAVYDADRCRRSQEYPRARTRFGILVAALVLAANI